MCVHKIQRFTILVLTSKEKRQIKSPTEKTRHFALVNMSFCEAKFGCQRLGSRNLHKFESFSFTRNTFIYRQFLEDNGFKKPIKCYLPIVIANRTLITLLLKKKRRDFCRPALTVESTF